VQANVAQSIAVQTPLDNYQSLSLGSLRRVIQISEAKLGSQGETLSLAYLNLDRSDSLAISYTYPINLQNGTLNLNYQPNGKVVTVRYRQPILQTSSQELALGLSFSNAENQTFSFTRPSPFSPGADNPDQSRLSVLRFSQDYVYQGQQQAFAARSELRVGLNLLNSVPQRNSRDDRFFIWVGQVQWVRELGPDTLFLLRADVQLADRRLAPLQQFSIGGPDTVRGYSQNYILTDQGALLTAETRIPILRVSKGDGLLQLTPFIDVGHSFDLETRQRVASRTIASLGLGLKWQMGKWLQVHFDYGVPLFSASYGAGRFLRESRFSFSVVVSSP
jgi:hemolysin activation/secretion protein